MYVGDHLTRVIIKCIILCNLPPPWACPLAETTLPPWCSVLPAEPPTSPEATVSLSSGHHWMPALPPSAERGQNSLHAATPLQTEESGAPLPCRSHPPGYSTCTLIRGGWGGYQILHNCMHTLYGEFLWKRSLSCPLYPIMTWQSHQTYKPHLKPHPKWVWFKVWPNTPHYIGFCSQQSRRGIIPWLSTGSLQG